MKKIVILEDDDSIASNLKELLERSNYTVFNCNNGIDGIEVIKKILPDLIISDIMMPGLNGYEIREKLASEHKTAIIPFIYLTALSDLQDFRKGMNLGADDYFVKPFRSKDLLTAIETRLNKYDEIKKESLKSQKSKTSREGNNRLLIKSNDGMKLVDIDDIKYIKSESEYSYLFLSNKTKILVRKLLKEWEEILDVKKFVRIHRATIINLSFVEKVTKKNSRSLTIVMKDCGTELTVSQRFTAKLRKSMGL